MVDGFKDACQGVGERVFSYGYRLVFWYDAQGHFADALDELSLDGVQIINMTGQATFGVKLRLELEEPETPTLLYFPYADQRISLDLDYGVKVNYGKFGNLLAEVKPVIENDHLGIECLKLKIL